MLRSNMLLDPDVAISRLKQKYPTIDFSESVYKGAHELLTAVCPKHGPITKKVTHWGLNGCVQCNKEHRQSSGYVHGTKERVAGFKRYNEQSRLKAMNKWNEWCSQHEHEFDFSQVVYTKSKANVKIRCRKHDIWFEGYPDSLIKGMNACPACVSEKLVESLRYSDDQRLAMARAVHGDKYQYLELPDRRHGIVRYTCPKHGEVTQYFHNHLNGMGCPSCARSVSKSELELRDWVASLGVTVSSRNRTVIPPKEIDIFLPDQQLAIEYNGLYWHSEVRTGPMAMRQKWELLRNCVIRMISVFEDEWVFKPDIVKRAIMAALGRSEKLFARKLVLQPVSPVECAEFTATHHISGDRKGSIRLGLYEATRLRAVLVCARHPEHEWEIIRYASDGHIVGGFNRLFSHFVAVSGATSCLSYCDLRYGTGNTYRNAGFKEVAITNPDYFWFKKLDRIPRYQTQKAKLKSDPRFENQYSEGLTELEICTRAGYSRVFGIGHIKFIWSK